MASPPRDENGVVTPHDDADIANDDGLLRRIIPDVHVYTNDNGDKRISSAAFKESSRNAPYGGMSVDIESLVVADGIAPASRAGEEEGLVRLPAEDMRNLGFKVGSDPIANDPEYPDNPYHGEVWGISKGMRKGPIKRAVMQMYSWVKNLDGVT